MNGKIGFEEHFALPETLEETRNFAGDGGIWKDFCRQILDLGAERLENMDKSGIELALLSLNAPGLQAILNADEALYLAQKSNERMADAVSSHPAAMPPLLPCPCMIRMLQRKNSPAV
jgi:2,3-dihydroxybenzoate decarboxylase